MKIKELIDILSTYPGDAELIDSETMLPVEMESGLDLEETDLLADPDSPLFFSPSDNSEEIGSLVRCVVMRSGAKDEWIW